MKKPPVTITSETPREAVYWDFRAHPTTAGKSGRKNIPGPAQVWDILIWQSRDGEVVTISSFLTKREAEKWFEANVTQRRDLRQP